MPFSRPSRGIDWKHDQASRSAAEVETAVEEVLRCVRADDPASANQAVDDWSPEDLADLIVHMPLNHARTFLDWLPKQKASRVLADMHRDNRAALSRTESEGHLSELLGEMPPDVALDTFRSLPKRMKGRMASLLTDLEALQDARKYPEGTVGHIMDRRIVAVPLSSTASEAVEAIKAAFESKGTVGTIYALDSDKIPVGVFRPRDLLAVPPDTPIRDFMQTEFPVVLAEAGHADGFDLEIIVRTAQERVEIAQTLQNTFAQVGINVSISQATGKQTLAKYRAREFQIYVGAWGPDYPDPHTNADTFAHNPDNRLEAKLTGKLAWRNGWDIPEMTKRTEAAVEESDTETRRQMYVDIQRDWQKVSPFVPMFQKIEQVARRGNVSGFVTGSAITAAYYWTVTK